MKLYFELLEVSVLSETVYARDFIVDSGSPVSVHVHDVISSGRVGSNFEQAKVFTKHYFLWDDKCGTIIKHLHVCE